MQKRWTAQEIEFLDRKPKDETAGQPKENPEDT